MSTLRNVFFMGSSTAVRLGFSTLIIPVMGRALGPEAFGIVMLWTSISALICLLANFGMTTYVLREIGANPKEANGVMCTVLTAKLLLSGLVVALALAALPMISSTVRWVFILLLLSQLADSMTEFFNVGFRATNRFAQETRIASVAAILQFFIVGGALLIRATPLFTAAGILVSRIVVVLLTWGVQRSYFSGLHPSSIGKAVRCIRQCTAYGVDYLLQGLFGQVDSVLLNHFAGPAAVGVYQAGMRVFNGGAQAATVLANVFLPRAAAAANDRASFKQESRLVQRAFIGAGAVFGLLLAVFSTQLTNVLFGARFEALAALFPWFGLLFFVRFFASSWGVILTSAGQQSFRAWSNILLWVVELSLAALWIPHFNIVGWLMALVCGHVLLSIIYMLRGMKTTPLCFSTLSLTGICSVAFLPFMHLPHLG